MENDSPNFFLFLVFLFLSDEFEVGIGTVFVGFRKKLDGGRMSITSC